MNESNIWKTLQSSQWRGMDPPQFGYLFVGLFPNQNSALIEVPGSGVPVVQKFYRPVHIEGHQVTIEGDTYGSGGVYFFDEKYQHLRSLTKCSDRIVKEADLPLFRKNSSLQLWNEIKISLNSKNPDELRETLFLISTIYGQEERPQFPEVLSLTYHPLPELRAFAVWAGAHSVVPLEAYLRRLLELKSDPDSWVRSEVDLAIKYKSYSIDELLSDPREDIRSLANEFLKR